MRNFKYYLTLKHIRIAVIALCVCGSLGYVAYRSANIIRGAVVTLSSEETDGVLAISGTAKNTVSLLIDGREVMLDEQGNFSDTLLLPPGSTTLSVVAADKRQKTNESLYRLYRRPETFGMKTIPRAAADSAVNYQ